MAGRRRRRPKSTIKENRRPSCRSGYQPAYSDLPTELLELIISPLNLRDNIRASAVCKKWLAVATSTRKPNKPPWLMFVPKFGDLYEFFDPLNRKTYWLEFPELRGTRICYSKDGWLLLSRPETRRVLFFSPYTRVLIDLPKQQLAHQLVAFSAPPTSSSCVIVAVKTLTPAVVVSTCHPGATEWTRETYYSQASFGCGIWNKIVFCKGLFYCLSLTGRLGVFDPAESTWDMCSVPPPKCSGYFLANHPWRSRFMAEHGGDIFVIYTYANLSPFMYKLDERKERWVEISSLGGVTLFANSLSSIVRTDFHGKMRNRVYFCKVLFYGKRCVTYSPDDGRYYPRNQNYDWGEQDPCESSWIDAPEDISIVL